MSADQPPLTTYEAAHAECRKIHAGAFEVRNINFPDWVFSVPQYCDAYAVKKSTGKWPEWLAPRP